jgi:predicted DCC family thiol-disulfide oxidoreductase YuxK
MSMTTPSDNQLTVIFDGTCGFCTDMRSHIERRDHDRRVAWLPCQATRAGGGSGRMCDRTVVSITPEGNVDTGARAMGRILTVVTGSPWPYRLATMPILCPLLSMVYAIIARVRSRLPGGTPWCDEHPEECRPGAHDT